MNPIVREISPSQIKLLRQCPRRFTFRYVEGLKEPQSAPALHGSVMHKHLENYLLRGKRPPHVHAMSAVPHAPKPLTALAEARIVWQLDHPWTYQGIMDFSGALVSRANFTTTPFMHDLLAPIVIGDFKFTSQLKYALKESEGVLVDADDGSIDPQSTMYASRYFAKGYELVHGKWVYTRTTGKTKTVPVWVDFRKDRIMEEMATTIARDAGTIHQLYQIRPKGNDVAYDKGGCFAFNTPCPHLGYCNRPSRMFDCAETDAEPVGAEDMGFADNLMKNFPGTEAPPVEGEEIPDVEGDIPDVEGEEVPELEERGMDEAEQLELINEQIAAQRAERGTVERGTVNPPEAPATAAATPDEAFERFGDPVPEKAPKVKKEKAAKAPGLKFGTKQRGKLFAKALELKLVTADNDDRAPKLAKLLTENGVDVAAMFPELAPAEEIPELGSAECMEKLVEAFVPTESANDDVPDVELGVSGEQIPDFEDDMDAHDGVIPSVIDEPFTGERVTHHTAEELLAQALHAEAGGAEGAREVIEEIERGMADKKAAYALPVAKHSNVAQLSSVDYDKGWIVVEGYGPTPIRMTVSEAATLTRSLYSMIERVVGGRISFDI